MNIIIVIEYAVIRPLVKQGSQWIQSHFEPLLQLQSMLDDAEMCSTVASQIISIKCKTRCVCVCVLVYIHVRVCVCQTWVQIHCIVFKYNYKYYKILKYKYNYFGQDSN